MTGRIFGGLLLALLIISHGAVAQSVSVFPRRIELTDQQRTQSLTLLNRGTEPATYRISLVNLRQTSDGAFHEISDPSELQGEGVAAPHVRYSPRQIVLPPNQPQTVRFFSRLPRSAPDGEYRSHIVLSEIPSLSSNDTDAQSEDFRIEFAPVVGVRMPIFIRKGELPMDGMMLGVDYDPDANRLFVKLENTGKRHLRADLYALEGDERIGYAQSLAVYLSTQRLDLPLPLTRKPEGDVRLLLREAGTTRVLAERTISVPQ